MTGTRQRYDEKFKKNAVKLSYASPKGVAELRKTGEKAGFFATKRTARGRGERREEATGRRRRRAEPPSPPRPSRTA
jgi:hypothetical protein